MLSRDRLEKALATLDWAKVEPVLAAGGGAVSDVAEVADVVLKTSSLVFRYPSPAGEVKRQKLFDSLLNYFAPPAASTKLQDAFATLRLAEDGYRTIVRALATTGAGKLPVGEHLTAALELCEREVGHMQEALDQQQAERPYITQHVALRDEEGKLVDPDAVLEQMVNMVGMTLQMHAFSHGLFDKEGVIVAPLQGSASPDSVHKVGATAVLAFLWRRWENTEERARFVGKSLQDVLRGEWPEGAPSNLERLVRHTPEPGLEVLHQVGFERLKDWLSQNFFEMMSDRAVEHLEVGGEPGPHRLPPEAIVSLSELHAASAVANVVNYDIAQDQAQPGGARLLEWVRGYAALSKLSEETPRGERISKSRDDWAAFFVHWGLTQESAEAFIRGVTFRKGSRDLFDHPLIKQTTGEYMLFRPAFHSMNIAQVLFSTLSHLREPLQKKGDAFEKAVIRLFEKNGLKAYSFTEKRADETYQIDVLVPWGKYLFLFECKNRALPQLHPVLMHRFDEETAENLEQIKRIVSGFKQHPDILAKHLPEEDRDKEIVPCILNALPYSIPGGLDDVYFYDFSALSRFFKSGEVTARSLNRADGPIGATPWLRIWAGGRPTPEDLLVQMKEPLQFTAVQETLELVHQGFPLPENVFVMTHDFRRIENRALAALAEKLSEPPKNDNA